MQKQSTYSNIAYNKPDFNYVDQYILVNIKIL